jgi:tRNA(Arg) A34 adenosine deaminase TadA
MPGTLAPSLEITLPGWVDDLIARSEDLTSPDQRMGLAIDLARENVAHGGGPFGAAVFEIDSHRLVAPGVNLVLSHNSSSLHAEVVALMFAERRLGSYSLASGAPLELVTSCEPCAMCLGATLWSGVKRLVCGATRDDAAACGFDEGPVFDESYRYLEDRGIEIVRNLRRHDAAAVLRAFTQQGGPIYNP